MSILRDINGTIATITIERPEVRNALDLATAKELTAALREAGEDAGVRAVVLTGTEKAFCAGQDLGGDTSDVNRILREGWCPLIQSVEDCPKPVVAAVAGVCAGAGFSLALACDLIFSKREVPFYAGFTRLGLVPDAGMTHILTRHLGTQRAMEFCLMNRPLGTEELQRAGLINGVGDDPLKMAFECADKIGKMAPLALSALKRYIKAARDVSFSEAMALEVSAQLQLGASADFKEGVAAFLEKRPPDFRGV